MSMASSIFDPLGFLCVVFLHPKLLLQQLTGEKLDWDQEIDEEAAKTWTRWYSTLKSLEEIKIPRCVSHEVPINEFRHEIRIQRPQKHKGHFNLP